MIPGSVSPPAAAGGRAPAAGARGAGRARRPGTEGAPTRSTPARRGRIPGSTSCSGWNKIMFSDTQSTCLILSEDWSKSLADCIF